MITLTQGAYPSDPDALAKIAYCDLQGDMRSMTFACGQGPWVMFVGPYHDSDFFLRNRENQVFAASSLPRDVARPDVKGLYAVICRVLDAYALPYADLAACCVVVRARSAIMIYPDDRGIYLPSPAASSHELIEDQALLEQEFPGIFTFTASPR